MIDPSLAARIRDAISEYLTSPSVRGEDLGTVEANMCYYATQYTHIPNNNMLLTNARLAHYDLVVIANHITAAINQSKADRVKTISILVRRQRINPNLLEYVGGITLLTAEAYEKFCSDYNIVPLPSYLIDAQRTCCSTCKFDSVICTCGFKPTSHPPSVSYKLHKLLGT